MKRTLLELQHLLERAITEHNARATHKLTRGDVVEAMLLTLPELSAVEHSVEVWDTVLDEDSIEKLVCVAASLLPKIEVCTDSTLVFNGMFETKADVKMKGEKWRLFRYDADPFPSNPHAHNFRQNVKLHLGNGAYYRARRIMGTMRKKDLVYLREAFAEFGIELPSLSI
jgi:hypothetical protein